MTYLLQEAGFKWLHGHETKAKYLWKRCFFVSSSSENPSARFLITKTHDELLWWTCWWFDANLQLCLHCWDHSLHWLPSKPIWAVQISSKVRGTTAPKCCTVAINAASTKSSFLSRHSSRRSSEHAAYVAQCQWNVCVVDESKCLVHQMLSQSMTR